ncbi:glycosyltransferase family 8 protein [Alloprevotella sp. OH1205_COT-284]|uniref:glycosyltransferase family 8 protein n=1 Tax=Alloprevotella sp. OH1205_COT-284 TaxID=2491043 RepID=UPI000F5F3E43|nr:glycosyltransferase [Alloprevotella sp. OH1205_COT-284]RRD80067.1 glycosyltransferase family 8 protein [Alloprevotella sp. OH1205_COT-284]
MMTSPSPTPAEPTLIPIFFTFDEHYVVPAIVTFHSLLRHADPRHRYALHVLHFGLSDDARRRLGETVGRFDNATLEFHDTSTYDVEVEQCPGKSHFSKEIFFKLCAADLFPQYDRILCSDVDVVFLGDIAPSFFAFEGEDFYYAGVDTVLPSDRMKLYPDFSEEERYFLAREICACYLLFDLRNIRRDGMQRVMTDYYKANYPRLHFPEQDCMALTCREQVRILPLHNVVQNNYYAVDADTTPFYPLNLGLPTEPEARRAAFKDALTRPVQLHYIGPRKPWNSLGVTRQKDWFAALIDSGQTAFYLRSLPSIVRQRCRQYSAKRLFGKLKKRLSL